MSPIIFYTTVFLRISEDSQNSVHWKQSLVIANGILVHSRKAMNFLSRLKYGNEIKFHLQEPNIFSSKQNSVDPPIFSKDYVLDTASIIENRKLYFAD